MKNVFLFVAFSLFSIATIFSQTTTSGVSGKLSDTKDGGLPNAVILFVHTPTGTRYEVEVRATKLRVMTTVFIISPT